MPVLKRCFKVRLNIKAYTIPVYKNNNLSWISSIQLILNSLVERVYSLYFTEMKILILISYLIQMRFQFAEAIFRSLIKPLIQKNSMTDNRRLDPVGQCKVPCQLEPFWIPFAKVLELSDIPRSMHFLIRSKFGDMIDVGKCAGNCNSSFKSLYENLVRPKITLRLP